MTKEQTKAVKVSSGPPKTDTNSLTELRREIDHVRDMSDRSYSREKYFMVLVSVIFSAATGVSTYSVYDNSARARESVERSEKLVEELSGLQRPSYLASFGPAYPTESGELIAEYDLVQNWPSEDGSYIFQISLPVSGRISGPLGRAVGIEFQMDGPIVDWMATLRDGSVSEIVSRKLTTINYMSLANNQFSQGMIVARNSQFNVVITADRIFDSCEDAKRRISQLISDHSNKVGKVIARPVFADIDEIPGFAEIQIFLPYNEQIFCSQVIVVEEVPVVEPKLGSASSTVEDSSD